VPPLPAVDRAEELVRLDQLGVEPERLLQRLDRGRVAPRGRVRLAEIEAQARLLRPEGRGLFEGGGGLLVLPERHVEDAGVDLRADVPGVELERRAVRLQSLLALARLLQPEARREVSVGRGRLSRLAAGRARRRGEGEEERDRPDKLRSRAAAHHLSLLSGVTLRRGAGAA
jgi:hypothetical protein